MPRCLALLSGSLSCLLRFDLTLVLLICLSPYSHCSTPILSMPPQIRDPQFSSSPISPSSTSVLSTHLPPFAYPRSSSPLNPLTPPIFNIFDSAPSPLLSLPISSPFLFLCPFPFSPHSPFLPSLPSQPPSKKTSKKQSKENHQPTNRIILQHTKRPMRTRPDKCLVVSGECH